MRLFSVLFLVFGFLGCGLVESVLDELLEVEASKSATFSIPAAITNLNEQHSVPLTIPLNFSEELTENQAKLDSLADVTLESIDLQVKDPVGGNFDFVQKITLRVDDQILAQLESVPMGQNMVTISAVSGADILGLSRDDELTVEVGFQFREEATQDHQIEATNNFKIKATIL